MCANLMKYKGTHRPTRRYSCGVRLSNEQNSEAELTYLSSNLYIHTCIYIHNIQVHNNILNHN